MSGGSCKHGAPSGSSGHTPMKSALGIEENLGPAFSRLLGMYYIPESGQDIFTIHFFFHNNSVREMALPTFHRCEKNLQRVSLFAQRHTGSMFVCAQGRKKRDQRLLPKYWSEAGAFWVSIIKLI